MTGDFGFGGIVAQRGYEELAPEYRGATSLASDVEQRPTLPLASRFELHSTGVPYGTTALTPSVFSCRAMRQPAAVFCR